MPVFTMCRKFISFVSALSMLISVNIINMLCCSFSRMAVEIFQDPLLVMYRCFTTTGIILSFYPLLWYCEEIALLCVLPVRQVWMTSFWFKISLYCFISIVVLFSLLYIVNIQLFGLAMVTQFTIVINILAYYLHRWVF